MSADATASSTDQLIDRLGGSGLEPSAEDLVLAALLGEEELDDAIRGESKPERPARDRAPAPGPLAPSIYLGSIEVTGIRGIADAAKVGFTKGPGLTLVVGRN